MESGPSVPVIAKPESATEPSTASRSPLVDCNPSSMMKPASTQTDLSLLLLKHAMKTPSALSSIQTNGDRYAVVNLLIDDAIQFIFFITKKCDKLCGDGERHRKVTCFRKVDEKIQALNDTDCEGTPPVRSESCFLRPCEGVDWITSDWSGCKNKCGLDTETRRAQCVSPKGKAYEDKFCKADRKPELSRPCMKPTLCEYMWFASQWSEVRYLKTLYRSFSIFLYFYYVLLQK